MVMMYHDHNNNNNKQIVRVTHEYVESQVEMIDKYTLKLARILKLTLLILQFSSFFFCLFSLCFFSSYY